jgi:hypothetical protein
MKIIDIQPNPDRNNDSPYIYKVTFISKDGTIRKAISKFSQLQAWLQELHQVEQFHLILNKYQTTKEQ